MFQEDIHIVKKMAREIAREEIELAFGDATPLHKSIAKEAAAQAIIDAKEAADEAKVAAKEAKEAAKEAASHKK